MYNYLMMTMLLCIGTAVTMVSIPLVSSMLTRSGLLRDNYRKEKIPVSMGICFIPGILINSTIFIFCNVDIFKIINVFILLFAVMSMVFVGVIDDILGDRGVTGLNGHFKSLLKGKLTTGGFKALLGGFVGLCISVSVSKNISGIIVGTLVVALSTNLMNLFDLRPGRALKVYLFIVILMFIFSNVNNKELISLVLPVAWSYFYFDVKAKSMMGDAGSNVLGITIGVFMVEFYDLKVQVVWLILLIAIHLVAEKYSITKIIEKNKFLNYLDQLGRN